MSRSGSPGVGAGRANAALLSQDLREWPVEPAWREGHQAGADRAGALAGGECPTADGMRNSKKATSYFAKGAI